MRKVLTAITQKRDSRSLWVGTGVILFFNVLLVAWLSLRPGSAPLFTAGAATLLLIVVVRQVLAMLDNRRLYARLNQAYSELAAKNAALTVANERLTTLATTDPLTELPNQRAIITTLELELERGRRYGRTLAVLFVDLDHFKKVNDACGHLAGDAVLQEVSTVMRGALRSVDTVGRWGGEEFVVVLPEVDSNGAVIVAERIRESIATHAFSSAPCWLTASIGIAAYPKDAESRTALIEGADRAMYAAKYLGRNEGVAVDDQLLDAELGDAEAAPRSAPLAHTVEGLSSMIAGRAHYTTGHISNLANLAAQLALALGMEAIEVSTITLAARLHDIGKVAVPDAVLLKPGPLNDDEWMLLRRHPLVGADVVSRIHGLGSLAPFIRSHHERWDGVGYPDGLAGEEIPLGARILAVVDAYEAMTGGRIYQEARAPEWALSELRRCAGSQFDPRVVEGMERVIAMQTRRDAEKRAG